MLGAPLLKNDQTKPSESVRETYAGRSRRKRARKRILVSNQVATKITKEVGAIDPLSAHKDLSTLKKGLVAALYLLLSIGLQLGIVFVLSKTNPRTADLTRPKMSNDEKITVNVAEPKQELEPRIVEPEVQTPQVIENTPPPEPEPVVTKTKRRRVVQLAADPVDIQKAPPKETAKPERRVVGLSFESTVGSGSGPAFAVGNTRMGQTSATADDARRIGKLTSQLIDKTKPRALNQKASFVPGTASSFDKPQRLGAVNLEYPPTLKAQGIEGNVVVLIDISSLGEVIKVKILRSSGHKEFDESAKRAARKQRFSPAKRDGRPTEYSLRYTYRFRLKLS